MKNILNRVAIATILSITLVSVINISSVISRKALSYRTATLTQTQPGPEMLGNSVGEMMDNLFATSGR